MEDMHYGFHRITMTNAAVILAKMHQFDFCGLLEKGQLFDTDNYRIFVPKDVHGGESEFYQYSPRAYPLNELKELAPTRVLEIIERLEMFDEANGKAIFDHYVVIVPGYRIEKNTRSVQEMDTTLIQRQAVTPIVLGERDGKCYFICYWI